MRVLLLLTILALPLAAQTPRFQGSINAAIDRGCRALVLKQKPDGRFARGVGHHALVMLALLHSGVKATDPMILRAKRPLLDPTQRVYDTAVRLMVIEKLGDPALRPLASKDARALLRGQGRHGAWHYQTGNAALGYDNSCTQYALLGLRAAQNLGYPTPQASWRRALSHLLRDQNGDGSMGYTNGASSQSMTTAALSSLAIVGPRCGYGETSPRLKRARVGIRRATKWLERNWWIGKRDKIAPRGFYTAYGLERGMAYTRQRLLGKRDWYVEGAKWLVKNQTPEGFFNRRDAVSTCFALLFLTRASRAPANESPANLSALFGRLSAQAPAAMVDEVVAALAGMGKGIAPAVVPYLLSETRPVREAAVRALRRITGERCAFDPARRPKDNRAAIARWREVVEGR